MTKRSMVPTGLALFAVLAMAMPSQAQDRDGRWLAFIGCWEAVGSEEEIGVLCFDFDGAGVSLTNYVGGAVVSTERLAADGQRRSVSAEGCEGWESVAFSQDGRRAFTDTEFACGDEQPRTGTGVMAFVAPNRWADVRALDMGGERAAWVQEYMLVGVDRLAEEGLADPAQGLGMAVRSARMMAAAPIDLEDVQEASGRMDAKAVETWIVAQGDGFSPSADDLVRLADAGVDESVIDAVVAVSYPERFIVEASGPIEEVAGTTRPRPTHYRGYMAFNPFYGPMWGDPYGWEYAPYGYGFGSPWGYRYGYGRYQYGYGYGYWGSRPGYVIIDRRPSGGRVYNGRGYSRSGGTSTGRIAQPRDPGAQPSYSGGAQGGGAQPASGSAPRRTAKRRPPGGR